MQRIVLIESPAAFIFTDGMKANRSGVPEDGVFADLLSCEIWELVDALEYIPQHHPQRPALLKILNDLCRNLLPMQERKNKIVVFSCGKPIKKGNIRK